MRAAPQETLGERPRVDGEELREIGFWKLPTQSGTPKWQRSTIGRIPRSFNALKVRSVNSQSYLALAEPGLVQWRPVAEEADAELLDAVEVFRPARVVAALLHFVDTRLAVVDGRIAVLDTGREREREASQGFTSSPGIAAVWFWSWCWSENGSPSCLTLVWSTTVEEQLRALTRQARTRTALLEPDLDRATVGVDDVGVRETRRKLTP